MSLLYMVAACTAIAVSPDRIVTSISVSFLCIGVAVVLGSLVFDASLRDFGAWLFAVMLAAVAVFLPPDSTAAIIMAGFAAGFVIHAMLTPQTLPFLVGGLVLGDALAVLLDPTDAWAPAGAAFVLLCLSAWTMRVASSSSSDEAVEMVSTQHARPVDLFLILVFGGVFGALLGAPFPSITGVYSTGLVTSVILLGALLGVAFPVPERHSRPLLAIALVLLGLAYVFPRFPLGLFSALVLSYLVWRAARHFCAARAGFVVMALATAGAAFAVSYAALSPTVILPVAFLVVAVSQLLTSRKDAA